MVDYTNNFYESGYGSFDPNKNVPHYLGSKVAEASSLGFTVNPQVADQLGELSRALNTGVVPVEIGTMNMQLFETIPKEHFEEIRRKAKLTGSKVSLHAPIQGMDPSGFGERGWDESQQKLVERQLKTVVEQAGVIDPNGNMPITIHGSNTSGSTFKMEGKKKVYDQMIAVDKATGQLLPIKEDIQFSPHLGVREEKLDPLTAMRIQNKTQWRKDIDGVFYEKETADKILQNTYANPAAAQIYHELKAIDNPGKRQELLSQLHPLQKDQILNIQTADSHIHQAELTVHSLFDKAYRYGGDTEEEKKQIRNGLKKVAERYEKNLYGGYTIEELSKKSEKVQRLAQAHANDLKNQSESIQLFAEDLRNYNPNMLQSIEQFSTDKASETFSNVALHSFKKYGEGAPVISIENLYQGMGFSQGDDLKKLVEESQKKFVEKAVNREGYSESEAQKMAKKLIGVTFDVGHLNISKGRGFSNDDLVKEAEAIKKHVKHLHLTDNFGYNDSHLPIGMGNVPVKELLEALGDEGARARKINEVGGWINAFKTNPFNYILQAAGSQVYSSSTGPYWAQTGGFQQGYLGGYGMMLPDMHYQMFGAGFSQLPSDLGGQRPGAQGSRMSGHGME